jgi:hypothetical protein
MTKELREDLKTYYGITIDDSFCAVDEAPIPEGKTTRILIKLIKADDEVS